MAPEAALSVEPKPRKLAVDLAVDVAAAFGAAVSVAPFISLIDMGIMRTRLGRGAWGPCD